VNLLAVRVAALFRVRVAFENALLSFGVSDFGHLEQGGRQFAVLTAYRPRSKSQNKKEMQKLLADVQKMGYRKIVPQKASWKDAETGEVSGERSILIPNMSFEHATALMKKYDQDAIIFKDESGSVGVYNRNGTANMAYDPKTGDPSVTKALDKSQYSKSRSMSFGLNIVPGDFKWSDGPVTAKHIKEHVESEAAKEKGSEKGDESKGSDWWDSQTKEFQQKYLQEHPDSAYAKT
jgi:hypothetical protein